MKKTKSLYHGHRFPAVVISCAVRWYFRLSQHAEPMHQRGVPQISRTEFDIGRVTLFVLIVGRGQLRLIDVAAYSS
jgi:hypothetical protein